jgi:hypothetical protein
MIAEPTPETVPTEPNGIGGWLLIPIAGLLLVAIAGTWTIIEIAIDPAMRDLILSLAKPSLSIDLIGIALFWSVLPLIAIVLLFMRSRHFPMAYVVASIAIAIFGFAAPLIEQIDYRLDPGSLVNAIVPAIWCVGWAWYMLKSVRVKNTFVK